MKVLVALLACVVAANASYYVPSYVTYTYFCNHHYYVLPSPSCYCFTSYFPKTWCQSSYYTPILKVYPGTNCGSAGWRETPVKTTTDELRNLLNASLAKITRQMYSSRDSFSAKLDSVHAAYKAIYKKYLYMYYSYRYSHCYYVGIPNYYAERARKISQYCAQLDAKKKSVIDSFNASITRNIANIKAYHDRLVKSATDCLNNRLAKISQFKTSMSKKVDEFVSKFISMHLAIVEKNKQHVKDNYAALFYDSNDWWLGYKAMWSVRDYYDINRNKVLAASRTYRSNLNVAIQKLISYYTCAYKCYMATGCLSYSAKSYQTQCKSLGKWYVYTPCIKHEVWCLGALKMKFTPCKTKVLKTCNVDAAAGSIDGVIADIKSKRDQFIRDFDAKYNSFRRTWVSNFIKYKIEFARIVAIRHNFLCSYQRSLWIACGSVVWQTNLAQMKRDLLARASRVCAEYYNSLLARLAAADKAHRDAKARFNTSIDQLISSVTAKFNDCKSKRTTAIAAYKKKMEDARNAKRAALSASLNKAKKDHMAKFTAMMVHYYSTHWFYYFWSKWMCDCYSSLISRRISSVLSQFDAHWRVMIPKFVMHFACCYKCNVKAYVMPKCASVPCWTYKLPCHATYTYKYSCFCAHYVA